MQKMIRFTTKRPVWNRFTTTITLPTRSYHSYPDPDEKPKITQTLSDVKKQLDKTSFQLQKSYSFAKPFPGAPTSKGIDPQSKLVTSVSKLDNGLTVASQDLPGLMTSFAFIVKAGSSNETQVGENAAIGVTQFLELNAFKSCRSKNQLELITEIEKMGGVVQCVSTRENIIYCMDVLKENVEAAFQLFSESILHPTFPAEELEEARVIIELQQEELPSEVFSRDLVQRAGYLGSPLGNHHFCPVDKVNGITANHLYDFRNRYYSGSNSVLSAAGIDHETFVNLAKKYFHPLPANAEEAIQPHQSKYTGGMLTNYRTLKEPFIKVAMAFDCGGWKDDQLIATCVLQQLLGGGSSFSAGGPGKGMYTRLYTKVLNRFHWAESVESFLSVHDQEGMLGIDGACPPNHVPDMIRMVVQQFSDLAVKPVTKEELSRAKNMLKSMMMIQLESRLVNCEDIARQLITFGKREDPTEVCAKIDAITERDLMQVATRMMNSPPAIAVVGPDLSYVPTYEAIQKFTTTYYQENKKNSVYNK